MRSYHQILCAICALFLLSACSPPEERAKLGPTSDGYLILQATDGRTAELLITDRAPDGTLTARNRQGNRFEFSESRLTKESIALMHKHRSSESMISIRIKDIHISSSSATSNRTTFASSSGAGFHDHDGVGNNSNVSRHRSGGSATHQISVSTTSPFYRDILVYAAYVPLDGPSGTPMKARIKYGEPFVTQISDSGSNKPTVIVSDELGTVLDYETRDPKVRASLAERY
ncbi:MAG: hypothetical protein AAFX93_06730 [Verrucomicrobiota bacterium]